MEPRTIRVQVIREIAAVPRSSRVNQICWDFGVPPREPPHVVADDLELPLRPGQVVLITGPTGAGKSSLLDAIAGALPAVLRADRPARRDRRAVVDRVGPRQALPQALRLLTAAGLGEARLWIRRACDLSDGERFRAALAAAIGRALDDPASPPVLCDEFTAVLHRRLARAVAYNLRKLATRAGLTLIAATAHDDVIADLQPDTLIRLGPGGPDVTSGRPQCRPFSLRRQAVIEPGSLRDYAGFAPMHYRHRDHLGFVDRVFLLRDGRQGDRLGIAVFGMAPIDLALRNEATAGRFVGHTARLNRELRILRRLIIHPDVRGCSLGHWFVSQALPRVGTRFVECLSVMGAVNPVFERAGLRRVGQVGPYRGRRALLERMRALRLDPFGDDFEARLRRSPRVRVLVERTVREWAKATRGADRPNAARPPAAELAGCFRQIVGASPWYFLWDRQGEFPRRKPPPRTRPEPSPKRDDAGADERRRHDPFSRS